MNPFHLSGLFLAGVLGACDGSGRTANAPTAPVPETSAPGGQTATPAASPERAAPAAIEGVDAGAPGVAPAEPPPYPAAAIERARSENSKSSCLELVYKRGCAELRTGRVLVRLTLGVAGDVKAVEIVRNDIRRDPKVVAACLVKKLPEWKFEPPDGAMPVVELELTFSDKC